MYPITPSRYTWGVLPIVMIVCLATVAFAQNKSPDEFASERLYKQREAMWLLGSWAAVSISSGITLALQNRNPTLKYLGYQNVGWGAINAIIAGVALNGISTDITNIYMNGGLDTGSVKTGAKLLKELAVEQYFSKVLLINVGLDVGYLLTGATLMYAAKNGLRKSDEFFGSGLGVVIQGAFLLGFDIWQTMQSSGRIDSLEQDLRPLISVMPQAMPNYLGVQMVVVF